MGAVQTVLGTVEKNGLGHCQMHEHVFVAAGPATEKFSALLIDDEALSAQELDAYRKAGGGMILDAQPGGAGRNAQALRRMSEKSEVHIVCVTGFHLPMFYPADSLIRAESEEALYERFLGELTLGCRDERGGEPVRAGAVKAALSAEGCVGRLAVQLRAAARAAAEAEAPLLLHTEKGAGALEALALCQECGLAPSRVLVCHVDRQAEDFAPHEAIAKAGAWLEYDTIGRFKYHDDESEFRLIRHMTQLGFGKQLLLSLDTTRERLHSYGGTLGLTYLLETFLPLLQADGLSRTDIEMMTLGNPLRAFS